MLPRAALDFVCSVWKMFNNAELKAIRSFGEHFFLGALMLAGDDRFKLPLPPQSGLPWFVWVFWIIFPWLLTHQQPLFSRHCIGAKDPSSRHLGTNLILGRCDNAYDLEARQPSENAHSTKVSKTDLLTFAWSTMLHHEFVAIALCSDQVATWSIRVSISAANRPIFRLVALSAFGSTLWNLRGQLRKWISSANLTRNWEIWWRTKGTGSLLSEGANRAWMKTINDRMRRQLTSALYVPMKSSRRLLLVSVKC